MNQHEHKHHDPNHHHGHKSKPLHKNWMMWVAVVLMLGALVMYVLSDDEAIQPGAEAEKGIPVDAPRVPAAP